MSLATGTRLGPYEIAAPIGAGGMGEVYRARDTRLDRTVAIKVLPAHLASDPTRRERFEREAKAISSLNHPHICILHDVGREAGTDFLVMEYLEGETLAKRLERGPLPLDQLLRVAIEVADALDQAHRHGVIHRDLKPSNIMLVPRSGTKLMDFGLAKPVAHASHPALRDGADAVARALPTVSAPLTAEGTIVGTLNYMAPEQLEGKGADARSDLFAFGAVLYEMATGKKAFEGKKPASTMVAILEHEPLPMAQLQPMTPPGFERLVKTCLAKDPDERWQTAHDVLLELKWIAEGGSQVGLAAPVISRRKKRELLAWGVAGLLAVTLAALLVIQLRNVPPQAGPVRFSVYPPEKNTFAGNDLALSPDGRWLAFTARSSDGKRILWLRPLDSFTAQMLPGTEDAFLPFWSPDGKSIAFFSGGKLKKIEPGGGSVETLCDAGGGAGGTWNRDGVIVFAPYFEGGLMRVSAAGGPVTPVTQLDPGHGETNHLWPVFLPDGRHFLFDLLGRDNSGIYVASLDSSERRRLIPQQNITELTPVAYAPPGYLLFVRHAVLMAQPFDARRLELKGEPFRLADVFSISGPGLAPFSVSASGVLAYRQQAGADVVQPTWFGRDGKQLGTAGPPGPYGGPSLFSLFAISPDGRTLAATRRGGGALASVWTIDLVRGTATPFTASDFASAGPIWSPDGSRIVFSSVRDTPPNLYMKSLSGAGGEERVERSINQSWASDWSPDGRFILYYVIDPKTKADLWLLPLSGDRKPVPFLQTQFNEADGRISPDGKWVAFQSDKSGRAEVYVTSFPTAGREWQISTNGGTHQEWRGDGKELIYLAPERKLMALEVKIGNGFDAGVPKLLFQLPADTYAAARDDQRFLVALETQKAMPSPIQVVVNWIAGLHP